MSERERIEKGEAGRIYLLPYDTNMKGEVTKTILPSGELETPIELPAGCYVLACFEEASNEFKRIYLAEYGRMSDQEIDKLGDLANYSFQQLTSIVEKRKPTTPREQGSKLPQEQIMVPVRKVDEINKYLKKGYEIKIELSNKQVVLYIPERASHEPILVGLVGFEPTNMVGSMPSQV